METWSHSSWKDTFGLLCWNRPSHTGRVMDPDRGTRKSRSTNRPLWMTVSRLRHYGDVAGGSFMGKILQRLLSDIPNSTLSYLLVLELWKNSVSKHYWNQRAITVAPLISPHLNLSECYLKYFCWGAPWLKHQQSRSTTLAFGTAFLQCCFRDFIPRTHALCNFSKVWTGFTCTSGTSGISFLSSVTGCQRLQFSRWETCFLCLESRNLHVFRRGRICFWEACFVEPQDIAASSSPPRPFITFFFFYTDQLSGLKGLTFWLLTHAPLSKGAFENG